MAWMQWDKLCDPKGLGGMRFRDFRVFNLALQANKVGGYNKRVTLSLIEFLRVNTFLMWILYMLKKDITRLLLGVYGLHNP